MSTAVRGKILRQDLNLYDGVQRTATRIDSTGGTITDNTIGDAIDILTVYGSSYTATNASTLNTAINAIGSRYRAIVFSVGTWTIDTNITIPANITSIIPAGCVFSIDSGITLTVNGPIVTDGFTKNEFITGSGTFTPLQFQDGAYQILTTETAANVYAPEYKWGDLLRYVPRSQHAAILAGTSVTDLSTYLANWFACGEKILTYPKGQITFATGNTPANGLLIDGPSMRGTTWRYTGTGIAWLFGTSTTVLNVGCGLQNCMIHLVDKAATAIKLRGTKGATLRNIYIEGLATPYDNTRTNIGVHVDGADVSAFFNLIENVDCNHIHEGFRVSTTGTTQATSQTFLNCSSFGDVSTDNTSRGYNFNNSGSSVTEGQGSVILGGNIESCNIGVRMGNGAGPVTIMTRFEPGSNTTDIHFVGDSSAVSHVLSSGHATITIDTPATSRVVLVDSNGQFGRDTYGIAVNDRITLDAGAGGTFNMITNETNTGTGLVRLQAGAGSANYGGAIEAYAHGHASRAGDLLACISNGSGGRFGVSVGGIGGARASDSFAVDANATAGNTRMLVYDVDNGTLERVSVGAADSGGAGYKLLRIPN